MTLDGGEANDGFGLNLPVPGCGREGLEGGFVLRRIQSLLCVLAKVCSPN